MIYERRIVMLSMSKQNTHSGEISSPEGGSDPYSAIRGGNMPERRVFRKESVPPLPLHLQRRRAVMLINSRGDQLRAGIVQRDDTVADLERNETRQFPLLAYEKDDNNQVDKRLCRGNTHDGRCRSQNARLLEDSGIGRLDEVNDTSLINFEVVVSGVNDVSPGPAGKKYFSGLIDEEHIDLTAQVNMVSQHGYWSVDAVSGCSAGTYGALVECNASVQLEATAMNEAVHQHGALVECNTSVQLEATAMDEAVHQHVIRVQQEPEMATQKVDKDEVKMMDEALIAQEASGEAEDRVGKQPSSGQESMAAMQDVKTRYREYSYEELVIATNGFSEVNQIGTGGYGPVYRGKLHHTTVAIKVLKEDSLQGPKEFQQEIDLLSHMRHPHMVLLLGACSEKGCLVYEYLSNGSLEDRLICKGNTQPLPWNARFRIAAEVASALLYLHSYKPDSYVHRDLKPANVLLDQNMVSKLGDVGLTRLAPEIIDYSITEYRDTVVVGTFSYMDPEYQRTGVFTPRSDVYALGLVMLQLLTGRGPIGLTALVEHALREKTLGKILDTSAGAWPLNEATELACIAVQCCALKRSHRPDLETRILPKLEELRAVADCYAMHTEWSNKTFSENQHLGVPSIFLCPISKEMMEDPHLAADGFTYEYAAIKQWLQEHRTSPMTNLKLKHKQLTPNLSLRSAILEWKQRRVLCA